MSPSKCLEENLIKKKFFMNEQESEPDSIDEQELM